MACQNNPCGDVTHSCGNTGNNSFIIIIVLYILLAIIIGSCLF